MKIISAFAMDFNAFSFHEISFFVYLGRVYTNFCYNTLVNTGCIRVMIYRILSKNSSHLVHRKVRLSIRIE